GFVPRRTFGARRYARPAHHRPRGDMQCPRGIMTRKIDVEALCAEKGLRITEQRRVIARVLSEAEDHPDVEALHARASAIDPGISIATVYRTVRLFQEAGILERHDF